MYRLLIISLILSQFCWAETDIEKIKISKLAEGVWLHTSNYNYPNGKSLSSNGIIVENNSELILIDTAWGELATVDLLKRIQVVIGLPVKQAIVTHAHLDRIAGVDYLETQGVKVYAHPLTQKLTIQNGFPVPDNVLESLNEADSIIKFGKLQLAFFGAAHAPDNLIVWLPDSKILYGGCAIRAKNSNNLGNMKQAQIKSWIHVMNKTKEEFDEIVLVVPGHGEVGDVSLLRHTLSLINEKD